MSLHPFQQQLRAADPVLRTGRVRQIMPTHIEADGPAAPLGALCEIETSSGIGTSRMRAEVVRVSANSIVLSPFEDNLPTFSGARVTALHNADRVPVGKGFLGRAVDAFGQPADDKGAISSDAFLPLRGKPASPLEKTSPSEPLQTGIRAIDGLLTLGKGQRVGIFAASGVGKTSLLAQLMQQVEADVTILCLVGERGREADAIWNEALDETARARATLVAATSDQSAAMRVRSGNYALALAEYWRDRGKHVLLLLDSATRLALALREIGLAAGEPPTVRAYTPNVFASMPKMVERCGAVKNGGAITAILTVLSETDDVDDPVCELMKSLLDGHIVLSRTLAEQGQFPAIDICRSISRQAEDLVSQAQRANAMQVLEWLSLLQTSRTLVDAGLYVKGSNPRIDTAIERQKEIVRFLKQGRDERASLESAHMAVASLVAGGRHAA
ncbi:MAG TPA: FliI/YscN family ATPase [Rhizomicrobium sp.]|jgi:flagellum-specific ATP synthase